LFRKKKLYLPTLIPAVIMTLVAVVSLLTLLVPRIQAIFLHETFALEPMVITSLILLILAIFLILETIRIFLTHAKH